MGLSAQYLFASTENFPSPNITSANYAVTYQLRVMVGSSAPESLPESSGAAFAGRHTDNDGIATMAMWGDMQRANTAKFKVRVAIKEAAAAAAKEQKALEAESNTNSTNRKTTTLVGGGDPKKEGGELEDMKKNPPKQLNHHNPLRKSKHLLMT